MLDRGGRGRRQGGEHRLEAADISLYTGVKTTLCSPS